MSFRRVSDDIVRGGGSVNQLGEHYVDFTFAFEGDHDGATAAAEAWIERVETFGGIDASRGRRPALREWSLTTRDSIAWASVPECHLSEGGESPSLMRCQGVTAQVPDTLDDSRVLKYASVTASVEPTGATRHTVGGVPMGPAAALAVVQYDNDDAFYLFYLDGQGQVVTDTWHASVDAALDQAAFEYEGLRWQDAASQ